MSYLSSLVAPEVLQHMQRVAAETPHGCFVEVGVYQGGSASYLYETAIAQGRELFLYDTFCGIPYRDEIDSHPIGDFQDTSAVNIRAALPQAHVIEGVFPESLVKMPPVAFAHIDCDQYRATRDAILTLVPLMVVGGVMWFDDYGCLPSATQAIGEIFSGQLERVTGGKVLVVF